MWSVHPLDEDAAVAMVAARRDGHAHQLAAYRATAGAMKEEHGDAVEDRTVSAFGEYAVLQRGIRFEKMAFEWCEWRLARIRGGRVTGPDGPRGRRRESRLD